MSTDKPAEQDAQAEPGPQSVTGPRIDKGLVIVNTGKGKGKTTAAMGVLVRAFLEVRSCFSSRPKAASL